MVCNASHNPSTLVRCTMCDKHVHTTCMGLSKHAFPGGYFECADCVLWAAKIEAGASRAAREAAHELTRLKALRVRESSQATYASALHRYIHFGQCMGIPPHHLLPPAYGVGPEPVHVHLFIAWAGKRYKISTIKSTMAALSNWCKSKGVDPKPCISNPQVKQLIATTEAEQGPAGLPVGKAGMSKALLGLLWSHCAKEARGDPNRAQLYCRDIAWLLLGFYGMLRRSELVALSMGDVEITGMGSASPHIKLTIRTSKTDRRGAGAEVFIAASTQEGWDLAAAVASYFNLRMQAGACASDPFLVTWDPKAQRLTGERFKTSQALSDRLQSLLTTLTMLHPGIPVNPASYGMHSLRRGGVLAAWAGGVDIEKIKVHGRWASDAVRAYMTAGMSIKLLVTRAM